MASYTTTPAEARRRALRGLLQRLNYGRLNVETICRHVDAHGDAETCENVRYRDRPAVGRLIGLYNEYMAPADYWPDTTDYDRWELGPEPTAAREAVAS